MKHDAQSTFMPAKAGCIAHSPTDGAARLRVDFLSPAGLAAQERARWARLSARAAPGNIFAQDWFMEPALRHCGTAASLKLAVVRQSSDEWLGVLPLTFEAAMGRCPLPSYHSWHATNQFLGSPLVLPGAERAFWQALLAHLDRRPGLALALCCDALPLDQPGTAALVSLCAEQDRLIHCTERFERPARVAHSKATFNPRTNRKLEKRLDTLEKRLARQTGPVRMMLHTNAEETEVWIGAFLALERAGWKGRAASALACSASTTGLFRETIRNGQRIGAARLASLRVGDDIIAMTCWFVAQGYGYGFKMAYDETWRPLAPGRLLMRRVARLLDGEAPLLFDTCNPPDTPSDAFWPDRRELAGYAVAIGGTSRRALFTALLNTQARWIGGSLADPQRQNGHGEAARLALPT